MSNKIPGIYNICDRWCERCIYQSKCVLFEREEEAEHQDDEQGIENFSDSAMQQLGDAFSDLNDLLNDFCASEENINNLSPNLKDNKPEVTDDKYEDLRVESKKLTSAAFTLIDEIIDRIDADEMDFVRGALVKNQKQAEKLALDVTAAIDVLKWHSTFIHSKVLRIIMELSDAEFDNVTLTFDGKTYLATKLTARLLYTALLELQEALLTIYNGTTLGTVLIPEMVQGVEKIIEMVKDFNPGIEDFKRPYFDN
ncbi:MAG: hypothetical protein ACPGLV_00085 [Bacteroidia bacterium]